MRTLFLGIIAAAGIGLAGASSTWAAPLSGSATIGQAGAENNMVEHVRHCRYSHWRRHCGHSWYWSRRS